jgi:hypothetical protein
MNKFRDWYMRNQAAITWFIIGFLTLSIIENVSRQEYVWAVVQAVLIWINYKLSNVRLR